MKTYGVITVAPAAITMGDSDRYMTGPLMANAGEVVGLPVVAGLRSLLLKWLRVSALYGALLCFERGFGDGLAVLALKEALGALLRASALAG